MYVFLRELTRTLATCIDILNVPPPSSPPLLIQVSSLGITPCLVRRLVLVKKTSYHLCSAISYPCGTYSQDHQESMIFVIEALEQRHREQVVALQICCGWTEQCQLCFTAIGGSSFAVLSLSFFTALLHTPFCKPSVTQEHLFKNHFRMGNHRPSKCPMVTPRYSYFGLHCKSLSNRKLFAQTEASFLEDFPVLFSLIVASFPQPFECLPLLGCQLLPILLSRAWLCAFLFWCVQQVMKCGDALPFRIAVAMV